MSVDRLYFSDRNNNHENVPTHRGPPHSNLVNPPKLPAGNPKTNPDPSPIN